MSLSINIREIREQDNLVLEKIIRQVLTEYGANKPGFAWQDPELSRLATAYSSDNAVYFVAELNSKVVGGCGVAPLVPAVTKTCELQKMYLLKSARGHKIGQQLLHCALEFAALHYGWMYLETVESMSEAAGLYQKFNFTPLPKPIIDTQHNACDRWYIKPLSAR